MQVNVREKDIQEILKKNESFKGIYKSHEVVALSDKPIGYMADHFLLKIHLDSSTKDFFLKAMPKNVLKRAEYLDETGFFVKETKFYLILVPKLMEFSSLTWAPKCYTARDGHFIIMEILNDYKTPTDKSLVFDEKHLKVAAATVAVFHASSLILEEKSGQRASEDHMEMLEENAYPQKQGHVRQKGLENAIEVIMELIQCIPKYQNSSKLSLILKKFPDTIRRIYKFAETSKKYRNVVSHGDLWVNNFMFKYEGGQPVACKLVDFQLARYAPPALDLSQLIYINSTRETRASSLQDILNVYCDAFEMELIRSNVDLSVLPRTEIIQSFMEFHLAGLIEAVLFGHLTLLPPTLGSNILSSSEEYDKFINQSRVKTCLKAFEEEYYRDRLTEIITDIIEIFILPTL